MVEVVNSMLRQCLLPTQNMITNLIKIELAYVNTNHPDFIGGSRAIAQLMDRLQDEKRSPVLATTEKKEMNHPPATAPAAIAGSPPTEEFGNSGLTSLIFSHRKRSGVGGTMDPGSVVKLPQVPETMRQAEEPTDRERIETEIIKSLLASYFDIVRKNFLDLVPKTIMSFLVNHAKENVQNELVSTLYKEEMLTELLRETSDIAQRRATCQEMRTLLQRAVEIVNEVRDFNTFK